MKKEYVRIKPSGKTKNMQDELIWTAGEQIPPKAFSEVPQERWDYINNKGTLVIDYQFEFADSFTEGLAAVKINNK